MEDDKDLVRYDLVLLKIGKHRTERTRRIRRVPDGEYVRYSQAEAIISSLIPRADNCGRYLAECNDGRLLYLNHANTWQECPNFIETKNNLIKSLIDFDSDEVKRLEAVIAAKEVECSEYRDYAAEKSNQVAALQAELAQIKKQNIENLSDLISKKMIKSAEEISDNWANNLIYGNNDDDDSNFGLSSALSGKEQS